VHRRDIDRDPTCRARRRVLGLRHPLPRHRPAGGGPAAAVHHRPALPDERLLRACRTTRSTVPTPRPSSRSSSSATSIDDPHPRADAPPILCSPHAERDHRARFLPVLLAGGRGTYPACQAMLPPALRVDTLRAVAADDGVRSSDHAAGALLVRPEAMVLAARPHEVRAELPDGRRCYLPLAWTDRLPRPTPTVVAGQSVRLTVTALRALAAWIETRLDDRKLDSPDLGTENGGHGVDGRRAAAAAVVGKAGAPRAGGARRDRRRRKRGPR
jgi:hypothetical protein